jgi:hypothetical protein
MRVDAHSINASCELRLAANQALMMSCKLNRGPTYHRCSSLSHSLFCELNRGNFRLVTLTLA